LVGLEAGDATGTSGKINQTSVMVNRSLREFENPWNNWNWRRNPQPNESN